MTEVLKSKLECTTEYYSLVMEMDGVKFNVEAEFENGDLDRFTTDDSISWNKLSKEKRDEIKQAINDWL